MGRIRIKDKELHNTLLRDKFVKNFKSEIVVARDGSLNSKLLY